mgnify:CR=1 FL=1|jgi:hypothetical protein
MKRLGLILTTLLVFLVAALPGAPCRGADILAHDGSLVKFDSGLVLDTALGLEWFPGPDQGMNWAEAQG